MWEDCLMIMNVARVLTCVIVCVIYVMSACNSKKTLVQM